MTEKIRLDERSFSRVLKKVSHIHVPISAERTLTYIYIHGRITAVILVRAVIIKGAIDENPRERERASERDERTSLRTRLSYIDCADGAAARTQNSTRLYTTTSGSRDDEERGAGRGSERATEREKARSTLHPELTRGTKVREREGSCHC